MELPDTIVLNITRHDLKTEKIFEPCPTHIALLRWLEENGFAAINYPISVGRRTSFIESTIYHHEDKLYNNVIVPFDAGDFELVKFGHYKLTKEVKSNG